MEEKLTTYEERTDRATHLQWCKERALQYVDAGDLNQALASMFSDLRKHKETTSHPNIEVGGMLILAGLLSSKENVRRYIEGFN